MKKTKDITRLVTHVSQDTREWLEGERKKFDIVPSMADLLRQIIESARKKGRD